MFQFFFRLLAGGLAESTGLLAVNDEVLEVNGIEVQGKSLDQVTDMMVANSSNLIVTVKPANQRTPMPRRGSFSRNSGSHLSRGSSNNSSSGGLGHGGGVHDPSAGGGGPDDVDEVDEIRDLTNFNSSEAVFSVNRDSTSLLHHHHHSAAAAAATSAAKKPVLHL